jgi:hypothetical protein
MWKSRIIILRGELTVPETIKSYPSVYGIRFRCSVQSPPLYPNFKCTNPFVRLSSIMYAHVCNEISSLRILLLKNLNSMV